MGPLEAKYGAAGFSAQAEAAGNSLRMSINRDEPPKPTMTQEVRVTDGWSGLEFVRERGSDYARVRVHGINGTDERLLPVSNLRTMVRLLDEADGPKGDVK